jgi:hypothetical protein
MACALRDWVHCPTSQLKELTAKNIKWIAQAYKYDMKNTESFLFQKPGITSVFPQLSFGLLGLGWLQIIQPWLLKSPCHPHSVK